MSTAVMVGADAGATEYGHVKFTVTVTFCSPLTLIEELFTGVEAAHGLLADGE